MAARSYHVLEHRFLSTAVARAIGLRYVTSESFFSKNGGSRVDLATR